MSGTSIYNFPIRKFLLPSDFKGIIFHVKIESYCLDTQDIIIVLTYGGLYYCFIALNNLPLEIF